MRLTRIYQHIDLTENAQFVLDQKASHHLTKVLRAKLGDEICLFNGQGGEYQARILEVHKTRTVVATLNFSDVNRESPLQLMIVPALLRGEKMDWLIQKTVELGVASILPMTTERTNYVLSEEKKISHRMQRWQEIIASACEQSGRTKLASLAKPEKFAQIVETLQADLKFILNPNQTSNLQAAKTSKPSSIALLIGPEGGFTPLELEVALANGYQPLQIGPRTLRAETASIVGASVMQSWYGDMSGKLKLA